tara:strand:+ start:239 stop:448 length:210 start_codon:yes stop_codon:yes gene_type:complete
MNNDKIEIKVRPKFYYYLNFLKDKLKKIIRPILFILIAICTLYIGFYIALIIIFLFGMMYLVNLFKNKL